MQGYTIMDINTGKKITSVNQIIRGKNLAVIGKNSSTGEDNYDERYDEILAWASTQKEISASLIQRRFQLGYPRAARLVETFEREGVVGPSSGSKPRQVLINNLNHLME